MPENPSSVDVQTSRWYQDGDYRTRCYAEGCDFRAKTKTSPQAAVKRHVEANPTHRVEVSRTQYKFVYVPEALS